MAVWKRRSRPPGLAVCKPSTSGDLTPLARKHSNEKKTFICFNLEFPIKQFTAMLIFVKTVERGSFTAAAAELGLTSQAAGKQVRELENHFGTRLLNRSTRSQSLTEVGRFYYAQCKRAVAEIDAAEAILAAQSGALRGTLRISAPVAFASNHLVPLLAQFMKEHPSFELDLEVTDNPLDVIGEGFDLAFRIGPLPNSTLNVRTLAPYRFVACAAADYLERRGTPSSPEDLANHECLGSLLASSSSRAIWHFDRGGKTYAVPIRGSLRINDDRALVDAALAGLGIVVGCRSTLLSHIREGRLVRLFANYEIPSLPINVLFAARPHMPTKLRLFLDWIVLRGEERSRHDQLADM